MPKLLRYLLILIMAGSAFGILAEPALAFSLTAVTATPGTDNFVVQWTTDVASSSIVNYGATTSYGSSTTEADTNPRVTQHSVTVSGLQACTTYHYQAVSNSLSFADTTASSPDGIVTTAGCTTAAPVVVQTASADGSLANTGSDNGQYLLAIISMLTIILSISQLRKGGIS